MKHSHLLLLACILCFVGCLATKGRAFPQRTPDAILTGLRIANPKELDAYVAKARMELEGFTCEVIENGTFSTTYRGKQRIDNQDFIRCRRVLKRGIDDVALVVDSGLVTDVLIDWTPTHSINPETREKPER